MRQLTIIGGGSSIKEGLALGLWDFLKDKYTFGCNYSYKYFVPTVQFFVDYKFWIDERMRMSHLPLIIGNFHRDILKDKPNNLHMFKQTAQFDPTLKTGVYKSSLCGLFALTMGIYLLGEGDIFLLGMDYGEVRKADAGNASFTKGAEKDEKGNPITHFYQGEILHRGIGKVSYYNDSGRVRKDYEPYLTVKNVKIYNVSPISKIPEDIIPKISYDEFFKRLDYKIDQQEERKAILDKLKSL